MNQPHTPRWGSYLAIVGAVVVWGTWPLWLRASALESRAQAFWTLAFIGAMGAGALALPSVRRVGPSRRDWAYLGLMGVCAGVNQATYFASLQLTSVARAALAHYLAPVLVASLAPWFLGERFERRVPLAMAGAVGGLVLVLSESPGSATTNDPLGVGLALVSAVFYAALLLCAKRIHTPFSPILLVAFHCGIGALVTLPYLLLADVTIAAPGGELAWMALAALAAGLAPATLFYRGLARVPAQHAAVLTYLEPVTSALLAWLFFGEGLGWRGAVGGALVLCAGVLVVARRA